MVEHGGRDGMLSGQLIMRLFQRLFNFPPEEVLKTERRLQSRYPVGERFPLKLAVTLGDWTRIGTVRDLAVGGIGGLMPRESRLSVDTPVRVSLMLEGYDIGMTGRIRHVRTEPGGLQCGLSLEFPDLGVRRDYLQLLMPVAIGSSLAPLDAKLVRQDEPAVHKAVYEGESASRLTIWSRESGNVPASLSFELAVGEYLVRGQEGSQLKIFSQVDDMRPHRISEVTEMGGDRLNAEIRRLFRWSVFNLRETLPESTRRFLLSFAH